MLAPHPSCSWIKCWGTRATRWVSMTVHYVSLSHRLFLQLGEVLGEDYERKMAVVAVLKQYAEDRDVDILCRSLDAILNTPLSRSILRHIRSAQLDVVTVI